jgi:hypothetical protein
MNLIVYFRYCMNAGRSFTENGLHLLVEKASGRVL